MLRTPFSGLAKIGFLVCERRAGVFCRSSEDDFSSVLGSEPCPVAVPAVPGVSSSQLAQLSSWVGFGTNTQLISETHLKLSSPDEGKSLCLFLLLWKSWQGKLALAANFSLCVRISRLCRTSFWDWHHSAPEAAPSAQSTWNAQWAGGVSTHFVQAARGWEGNRSMLGQVLISISPEMMMKTWLCFVRGLKRGTCQSCHACSHYRYCWRV